MIVGLGVELVELERFERAEARFGDRLLRRLFTERERAEGKRLESLAARFAAKVAARRALGLVPGRWHELEVLGARGQPPELHLGGASLERARALGVVHSALSLSHDGGACIGHVVLENDRA